MKVRKSVKHPDPGYPSQRQLSDYKRLLGIAAIGLSAVAGWAAPARTGGVPVRTGGKPAMEPRQTTPSAAAANTNASPLEETRILGEIPAVPGSPPPVLKATTNLPARTTYTVKNGDTLSALSERFLGSSSRWRDIAAVNPGVTPETLKVGQTLTMPAVTATNETEAVRVKGKMPSKRK